MKSQAEQQLEWSPSRTHVPGPHPTCLGLCCLYTYDQFPLVGLQPCVMLMHVTDIPAPGKVGQRFFTCCQTTLTKGFSTGAHTYPRTRTCTAALVAIAKRWKQPKCPSTDEWKNTMWSIHTTECYLTIKMDDILTHATMWMNLKNVMLSERSQTQKGHIVCDSVYVEYPEQANPERQKRAGRGGMGSDC